MLRPLLYLFAILATIALFAFLLIAAVYATTTPGPASQPIFWLVIGSIAAARSMAI
jgi:hypothetical protein